MGAKADLAFVGAPVNDPVAVARFIGGMVLTRRQMASLLRRFLEDSGLALTEEVRRAAEAYAEFL